MPQEDREALVRFALHLQGFVNTGLERHTQQLSPDVAGALFEGWGLQRDRFQLLSTVLTVDPEAIGLSMEQIEELLDERGLTGFELSVKLQLYEAAVALHEERPSPTRFADALKAADIPLGTLATIFVWLDPTKEAKEAIEFLFSWGRGPLRRFLSGFRRRRRD